MKKITSVLLAFIFAVALSACGKTEEKAEETVAPTPEVANPYGVQIKVMEKARDLQAESEKKVAEQAAKAAALEQQADQQ